MKKPLSIIMIGSLLVIALLLSNSQFAPSIGQIDPQVTTNAKNEPIRYDEARKEVPIAENFAVEGGAASIQAVAEPDAPVDQRKLIHKDFVWYTKPTSKGTIKNSTGVVLFQATKETPFIQLKSRDSIDHIVVVSGNRMTFLINSKTGEKTLLPKGVDIERTKGFELWEWLDADTLIGEVYVERESKGVNSGSTCCGVHNIQKTLLFLYDIKEKCMKPVVLPETVDGSAFHIGRIAEGGEFELLRTVESGDVSNVVGWFRVKLDKP